MDLQTLHFFCTAATEGSLTRAAQVLNYAQSNLSTRIHALEAELGVSLFDRLPEGVRLTEKGELLFDYAQRMLLLAEETASAVRDEGVPGGTLLLGSMESAALSLLPSMLRRYHERYPKVRTLLRTMPSQQAVQAVLDCKLDAAVVGGEISHPALEAVPLTRERLVLISCDAAPLEALLSRPLVVFPRGCSYRRRLEEIQAKKGIVPGEIMEMNSLSAIFASVSAGLGVSLFPASTVDALAAGKQIVVTELPFAQADIPVSIVHRRTGHIPSTVRAMAQCLAQWCDSI